MNLKPIRGLAALIVLAVSVAAFVSPTKAQVYAESVTVAPNPFLDGQLTAVSEVMQADVPFAYGLVAEPHVPFRTMANINHALAQGCRFFGLPLAEAYFEGRASVFDAAADLAGEPPTL